MKKSLIALAVLAASGAAMAQSSVTIYGIVDAYVGSLKNGLSTTSAGVPSMAAVSQTGVNSGGLSTGRWGLRGSEDLGGGLKANFQLEQGIDVDTGAGRGLSSGNQFDRQAWVGLSGGFGEVKFGRTFTAYDLFRGAVNHTANMNLSVTGDVFKAAGGDYTGNQGNQILYLTPNFSGVSAVVGYTFGENKTTSASATDTLSLHVKYAAGPLVVGYAYQSEEQAAGAKDTDYNFVGASYDFGVAKLVGGYNRTTRAATTFGTTKESEYQLGVSAPFGPTTVYFGYAAAKGKNAAGTTTEKASGYNLTATYALSKRTDVYAGVKSATEKNGAGAKVGELRQVALGLRHTF